MTITHPNQLMTDEEIIELRTFVWQKVFATDLTSKPEAGFALPLHLAKLTEYMTDGPGWCGDIYVMVWGGSPEYITTVGRTSEGLEILTHVGDCRDCNLNMFNDLRCKFCNGFEEDNSITPICNGGGRSDGIEAHDFEARGLEA